MQKGVEFLCVQTSVGSLIIAGKDLSECGHLFSNSVRIWLGKRGERLVGERKKHKVGQNSGNELGITHGTMKKKRPDLAVKYTLRSTK